MNDKIVVDMTDSGLALYIVLNSPTKREIKEFRNGNFQIKKCIMGSVIFFLYKFGRLQWMDAPYNVHLSNNLTRLIKPTEQNFGLSSTFSMPATSASAAVAPLASCCAAMRHPSRDIFHVESTDQLMFITC